MAYCVDIYRFNDSTEYEYKWMGRYGARGEKRSPRVKPTPSQIKKQNQRKREKNAQRILKANFSKGDLWCTLLYPKGTRKPINEVKDDVRKFLRRLRAKYKARDDDLKFMYRIEIGSRGGVHVHMVCNQTRGEPPIDMIIQDLWISGRVHFERFAGSEEDYIRLANYIVKEPTEEQVEKLRKLYPDSYKDLVHYSSSRNLVRPVAERKTYLKRTVKRLVENGPIATSGYYIDHNSVYSGINPFTGTSYLYYTEVRIRAGGSS